jgi:receptor expression-enhancing protein 1/2/3/4
MQGEDRISFIAAQRERLSILLRALDKEATNIKTEESVSGASPRSVAGMWLDGQAEEQQRPASAMSGLSKSRSEVDFEKIEQDDADDEQDIKPSFDRQTSGSWLPWSWGAKAAAPAPTVKDTAEDTPEDTPTVGIENAQGRSSGVDL